MLTAAAFCYKNCLSFTQNMLCSHFGPWRDASDVNCLKRNYLIGQLRLIDVRKEFTFSMSPRPQTCRRIFKEKNKWIKELANLTCKLLDERSERRLHLTVPTHEERKRNTRRVIQSLKFFLVWRYASTTCNKRAMRVYAPTGVIWVVLFGKTKLMSEKI